MRTTANYGTLDQATAPEEIPGRPGEKQNLKVAPQPHYKKLQFEKLKNF